MTLVDTPPEVATEPEVRELTKVDRCDICTAQAFVIAFKGKQELLFCGHHYLYGKSSTTGMLHRDALDMSEWFVVSYLEQLNEKPSVSANAD